MASQQSRRLEKLEALRGAAAFYVFVSHVVHLSPELAAVKRFFVFGQVAVLVFFILSGFVIYYATVGRGRDISFRDYFVRRFRRIFPPFVTVLGLTYGLRCATEGTLVDPDPWNLVGNLLQLQDKNPAGSWFEPYLRNDPLWSLSYEWWFYMMFFAILALTRGAPHRRQYVVGALAVLGFATFWVVPNQISLFVSYLVLWWSGLELAREYLDAGRLSFRGQWFTFVSVGTATVLWGIPAYLEWKSTGVIRLSKHPFLEFRHFVSVFLLLVLGVGWYRARLRGFNVIFGVFARVAPVSYVLYIIHVPVIRFAAAQRPTGSLWTDLLWMVPVIFGLSWLIEQPMQKWINSWMK